MPFEKESSLDLKGRPIFCAPGVFSTSVTMNVTMGPAKHLFVTWAIPGLKFSEESFPLCSDLHC
jgi:hypothetical protein